MLKVARDISNVIIFIHNVRQTTLRDVLCVPRDSHGLHPTPSFFQGIGFPFIGFPFSLRNAPRLFYNISLYPVSRLATFR